MATKEPEAVPISKRTTLSVPEAARLLGISDKHMWSFIHRREIPTVRLGGRVMVRKSTLDQWVAELEG